MFVFTDQDSMAEKAMRHNFVPSVIFSLGKEIYHYVGEDIVIYESTEPFGGVMWPAVSIPKRMLAIFKAQAFHNVVKSYVVCDMICLQALALCSFLENNKHAVNLEGKTILELGAGTGLVSIVATLLGEYITSLFQTIKLDLT